MPEKPEFVTCVHEWDGHGDDVVRDGYCLRCAIGKPEWEFIQELMTQRDELLAACEFYGSEYNWENDTLYLSGKPIPDSSHCARDGGELARAAIARVKGESDE